MMVFGIKNIVINVMIIYGNYKKKFKIKLKFLKFESILFLR